MSRARRMPLLRGRASQYQSDGCGMLAGRVLPISNNRRRALGLFDFRLAAADPRVPIGDVLTTTGCSCMTHPGFTPSRT